MLLPEILELLTDLRRLCELVRGQDVPDGERDGQPLLGELVTRRGNAAVAQGQAAGFWRPALVTSYQVPMRLIGLAVVHGVGIRFREPQPATRSLDACEDLASERLLSSELSVKRQGEASRATSGGSGRAATH